MRLVTPGNTISFAHKFFDGDGEPVDPPEVTFRIAKNATTFLAGPYTYTNDQVQRTVIGSYTYDYTTTPYITPGIYSARWNGEVEGVDSVHYESFQVVEPNPTANGLLDAPRTYGIMMESPFYQVLGVGETDRIFLVGHADGLELNNPYQINNMQEAINILGASSESPMVRALLEVYNAGARDIWLVAAAPESEYVPFDVNDPTTRFQVRDEWGGLDFYEQYWERLEETYTMLEEFDIVEILVPLEAPFFYTGETDFLSQLVAHCEAAYTLTGTPRIGIIGTRIGAYDAQKIDDMINDDRLDIDYGEAGKFVMIAQGEGTYRLPQMPIQHVGAVNTAVAALLATSPMSSGATYKILRDLMTPYGRPLTKLEVKALVNAKVNPLIRTAKGRRGTLYQSVLATDNTLASDGSDYWSIVQMRLVSKVIQEIKTIAQRKMGTVGFLQFRSEVDDYLSSLVFTSDLRAYDLVIERDQHDIYKANVDVVLSPFFGVREIYFQIQVGPGV